MSQSSLIDTPRNSAEHDARRSTRIERSVPLIVFGQNSLGEPFVERTVSTSLNLHGCRYPSRHDYGIGSWVALQVVGLELEPKPPVVRARVRSVHTTPSSRELQQVGVELENPGNVWGIVSPPQDWMKLGGTQAVVAQFAMAVAPALDPAPITLQLDELAVNADHKMAEVATFPSPSSAASKPQAPRAAEAPKPKRVLITPDELIAALQGKLQRAAEKAAEAAVTRQVDEAVREALSSIDDVRNSSMREIQELFPTRVEAMRLSSKEEFTGEVASHWKEQMEKYRGQAEEMAQRLEKQAVELRRELVRSLSEAVTQATSQFETATARSADRRYQLMLENTQAATQEALLKLDARSAEVQALAQNVLNSALAAFQRQTEQHVDAVLSETRERTVSALSSLDAESRARCEARRQELETEVARAAERSTDQFRKGMKAFLYSCLVAAVSAVDEHSKSTLDGLVKDNGKTLFESTSDSGTEGDGVIIPDTNDPLTH